MNMRVFVLTVMVAVTSLFASGKGEVERPDSYAFNRGVECFDEGDYEEAGKWFKQETAANPKNGYAYSYLGSVLHENDEQALALKILDKALKYIPKEDKEWRANTLRKRAEVQYYLRRPKKTIADLTAAIALLPDDPAIYQERANVYFWEGKFDLSDADYRKVTVLSPDNASGYLGLGYNAMFNGDREAAIEYYSKAIAVQPERSAAYAGRAEAYLEEDRPDEGVDDIIRALEIDRNRDAYFMLMNLAYPVMKESLQRQIVKDPSESYWHGCLGRIAQNNEEYEEALDAYLKADEIRPDAEILSSIGECYYHLGNYPMALEYIDRTLAMDPEDYDNFYNKANVLGKLGRIEEALGALRVAVEGDYFYFERMQTDDNLAPLRDLPEYRALLKAYPSATNE